MKPKRVKKNTKQFMVRMNPVLIKKVNDKRVKDGLEWSAVVEWMFNHYLEKL